jgi:hypothetical protein
MAGLMQARPDDPADRAGAIDHKTHTLQSRMCSRYRVRGVV